MNIALVTNSLNRYTINLLRILERLHTVCVFLPVIEELQYYDCFQIRKFTAEIEANAFQRYDMVICYSHDNWDLLIPIIKKVKCVSVVEEKSSELSLLSELSAKQLNYNDDLDEKINQLTKHIHWFDREVSIISERFNTFGLLSEIVKNTFNELYGVSLEKEWLLKGAHLI